MKKNWVKIIVVIIIAFVLCYSVLRFLSNNNDFLKTVRKTNETIHETTTIFSKVFRPLNEISNLNKELSKVNGIKKVNTTIGFNSNSFGRTNYIAVIISLKKGENFKNISTKLIKVLRDNYPSYKSKDVVTIVERNELNLGVFRYSSDVNSICKSPKEWDKLINNNK